VASVSRHATLPCLPGDSIFEAYRAGRRAGLTIVSIDLDLAADDHHDGVPLPGPELAERVGPSFAEVTSGLAARATPYEADLAREAGMARELAALMLRFESVLWVGGLAHWNRLVGRLATNDFEAPGLPCAPLRTFIRTRLAASALYRLTGQWPWLIANFAAAPGRFDPVDAERRLLHLAGRLRLPRRSESHEAPAGTESVRGVMDVARTAVYACNLAATRGLRELPSLPELLLAAKATIGDVYAARVHRLAMQDTVTDATRALPALTWEVAPHARRAGYRLNGRWLTTEAWWPADRAALAIPELSELDRTARDAHYENLPGPRPGERFFWGAYPPDEAAYKEFVRYLLRRASVSDEDAGRSAPFSCGMRDGLDVRATIRHWQDDTLYVREARRGAMRFTASSTGPAAPSGHRSSGTMVRARAAAGTIRTPRTSAAARARCSLTTCCSRSARARPRSATGSGRCSRWTAPPISIIRRGARRSGTPSSRTCWRSSEHPTDLPPSMIE
jgi:hypothetical protein